MIATDIPLKNASPDRALSILNTLHLILTLLSVRSIASWQWHPKANDFSQFGTEHENVSVVTDFTEP